MSKSHIFFKKTEEFLDKEIIYGSIFRDLGYSFKNKNGSLISDPDAKLMYWHSHKKNSRKGIFCYFQPKYKLCDIIFNNGGYNSCDADLCFSDYLILKKIPLWDQAPKSKNQSFYTIFKSFKKIFIHVITHDLELREIVTRKFYWRCPTYNVPPRLDVKVFEAFMDKILILGSKALRDLGFLYQEKEVEVKESKLTKYKEYSYDYIYKHQKSNVIFEFSISPEFSFIYDYLYWNVIVSHPDPGKNRRHFFMGDYLRFKKRPEWTKWKKLQEHHKNNTHKQLKLITQLMDEILLKDKNLRDILSGKKWDDSIPWYAYEKQAVVVK